MITARVPMLLKWLQQKTVREQLLLAAAAFVLTLVAFGYLLLLPLHQSRLLSEQRVTGAVQSLAVVQQLARELTVLRSTPEVTTVSQSLSQFLDESARNSNISISSLEPAADGSSVVVRVDSANMSELLRWVGAIENNTHAALDSLTVSPGAELDVRTTLRVRTIQP